MTSRQMEQQVQRIMACVLERTRQHFEDELGIAFLATTPFSEGKIDALALRHLTAIISVGGPASVLAAFSFDRSLAAFLLEVETAGLSLTEDERPQFLLDTVAETINIVLGHSTADLTEAGNPVVLSAPMVLEDGGRLHRPKGAVFTCVSHQTAHGQLDVDFFLPIHLFNDNLIAN